MSSVRKTVLCVEDNALNLRLMERILDRRPAVRMIAATAGHPALELARDEQPDLVLLDVHLPDIGGDEVLRRLRADRSTSSIPVVVVSADATPATIERFLRAGARSYLTKPIDVTRLLDLVDSVLAGSTDDEHDEQLSGPAIDVLRDLAEADQAAELVELVGLFITDSRRSVTRLHEVVVDGDAGEAVRLAHDLTGMAANFGSTRVPELSREVERLARTGSLAGADALVTATDAALERMHASLRREFLSS